MSLIPIRLELRLMIGIPTLLVGASCVPHGVAPPATMVQLPVTTTDALLRGMALAVPTDVADQPLPADDRRFVSSDGAPAFDVGGQSPDDAGRALECLTAAVYYEARSEPLDGQRAVAQVVLNRVRDRAFPRSVCGVVYQGSTRRTGCQFSFTCDGSMYRRRDENSWERARAVAAAALGGAVYAPVGAATSYHASYMLPWWAPSLTRIATVGAHVFYRWRNAMERAFSFRQSYAGYEPNVAAAGYAGGYGGDYAQGGSGVTVHYAGDDEGAGSVTVHRGTASAASIAATRGQRMIVSGVRIHRGVGGPEGGGDAYDSGEVAIDGEDGAI
ncbi:cell wall hydrolase [Sphingomonas sp. Tas61C01]|uniref:cell wall hydrolase n=1 Tax=Sphingomonas sp. Tas61C01 TaxID=3458297 RepID=UPI00403ED2C1